MRSAVNVPVQAAVALPDRQTTVAGTAVEVPVMTSRAVLAASPVTFSLKVAVAAAVSEAGVVKPETTGAVVSPAGGVVPPLLGGVVPPPACVAGAFCTVNDTAGALVWLPAASLVATTSVWLPSLKPAGGVHGLLHATKGPPSTEQRNVTAGSLLPNVIVGLGVDGFGASTCGAAGGVVSTTQDHVSGLLTDVPSEVSTENACGPSVSGEPTV